MLRASTEAMTMTMNLYGSPGSTNTERVLFTLAEKGQEARTILVQLGKGEQKQPEHLCRHPFGVIPVLEHDGFWLYESRAIMQYLDARFPSPPLTPSELAERARMWQWLSVEHSYLVSHGGVLRRNLVYGKLIGIEPDPVAIERALDQIGRTLDVIERALDGQEYLAGRFSLAEVSIMPELESYFQIPQATQLITSRPQVRRWFEQIRSRPAWQRVLADKAQAMAELMRRMQQKQ
jgi:glutathione S-transferase